jgi:hypothetical protein
MGKILGPDGRPASRMAGKVGRNDRCPCGSGRKFKQCCGPKQEARQGRFLMITVGVFLLAALAVGFASFTGERGSSRQVWDAEHGHYHTVGGSGGGTNRVWSEEHGHYH